MCDIFFIVWVWKYWNTHLLVQMNFMVWVSLVAGSDKSYLLVFVPFVGHIQFAFS
jgi:hypothetical protein